MKIVITSDGEFKRITSWLAGTVANSPINELRAVASAGESGLSKNTPKDTGETASGWRSEVAVGRKESYVDWYNVAHPEAGANVAKLIELGHGTGTGGYVPPNPYIQKSMDEVWAVSVDNMLRELLK